jgi:hypothetical protein
MKSSYETLISQTVTLGEQGFLGEEAQNETARYADLPNDIARCIRYIDNFFSQDTEEDTKSARNLLCQLVIVAYRDAKKQDASLAQAFAKAYIEDFRGIPGTALLPRWISLAEAALAFKNLSKSGNPSLIWQQTTRLVLTVNEFLDGLVGLLIVAWRCALGKTVNTNVLGNAYGSKVNEFAELTGGEDGIFYLIFRLADPILRNGIAHSSIWPDFEAQIVHYIVGQQAKIEYEMSLTKFMLIAYLGSHLAQAYIAALTTIVVMESGGPIAAQMIPEHLMTLFHR